MTIEELVISYLIGRNIPGIGRNVYAEVPVDIPDNYVLIRRSGGSQADYIRNYNVYTETISRTDKLTAARNHEAVIGAMNEIRDYTDVFRCALNSDYDATNTATKEYRFQALWQMTT